MELKRNQIAVFLSDSRFLYVEIYGCHFLCWISDALFREESQERDSMQERQCLHIIQNTQALGVKKGKSSKKHKRGINHRVKDYKARFGKKMPCRNGICHLPSVSPILKKILSKMAYK